MKEHIKKLIDLATSPSAEARDKAYRLREMHPCPWVLEECSEHRAQVNSNTGEIVFLDEFLAPARDDPESAHEHHKRRVATSHLVARLLVAISEISEIETE